MPELYDWQADTRQAAEWGYPPRPAAPLVPVRPSEGRVNAVNGHGAGCECPQCPGWYVARARAGEHPFPPSGPHVPAPTAPRPLLDQVVPVVCLLATVTVCGLVLVPVVVPVLAVGLTAMIVALVVLAVTVVGVLAVFGRSSVRRDAAQGYNVVQGQVIQARRGWRR